MPCSTPIAGHRRGGEKREPELAPALAQDVLQALHVDHADRDGEDDARKHAARQVLQVPGQRDQHDRDDPGEDELGELALRARVVRHGGLGRAAVDDEGAGQRRPGIGGGDAEDVGVLVDVLAMLDRVDARGRRALGDDHHEARARDRQEVERLAPGHVRPAERRQPPGDGTDHGDAPAGEIEPGAGDDHPDHHHERDGKSRNEPFSDEDGRDHENGQAEGQRAEQSAGLRPPPTIARACCATARRRRASLRAWRRRPGRRRR